MARIKIGQGYSKAPRRQLATKAARKSAPLHRSSSEDSESVSEEEYLNDSSSPTRGSNFRSDSKKPGQSGSEESGQQQRQRQMLYNDLTYALCSPSHERYGTFASCEGVKYSREGFILKSFCVEGAGELQFPLSADDISKLRGACEKAPFGQCWEVDASKVTFSGVPEFMSNRIQPLAMHAVRGLSRHGAAVELVIQLDKLVLCETDDHFTFRRARGKNKGLFATFLLQIPTEDGYEGGSLVVQHKTSKKTFDCHLVSSVGFCYTVFFADCKQQLQKIISGTRVCLVFNLVRSSSSAQALRQELIACKWREAEAALKPWLTEVINGKWNTYSPKLAIPLTHKYRKDELSFDALKGHDRIVLEVLRKLTDKNGKQLLDLHLCVVTDYRYGDIEPSFGHCDREHCDSGQDSDSDDSLHLDDDDSNFGGNCPSVRTISIKNKIEFWVGEEDKLAMAFGKLGLDRREIVVGEGQEPFYAEPDDKKVKKRRRDSGPVWQEWYHRVMLIVWPKELSISLFCETKVSYALDLLECTFEMTNPDFREHLLRILSWCDNNALRVWRNECYSNDSVTPGLLRLSTKPTESKDVLQQLFKMLAKTYSYTHDIWYNYNVEKTVAFKIGIRNPKVAKAIAAVVRVCGWTMPSSLILELVKECCLLQGYTVARLAKELFLVGHTDAGTIVADSTVAEFVARIAELQQQTKPVFTWCQPQAKLPSHPTIENFLKGPEERLVCKDFETYEDAQKIAKEFFWYVHDGHNAITTAGQGSKGDPRPFLDIRKTRHHFETPLKHWEQVQLELLALKRTLRKIKSSVKRAKAASVSSTPNAVGRHDSKRQRDNSEEDVVNLSSDSG